MNSHETTNLIKPTCGTIQESYAYSMDGEDFSGYDEYEVIVTEWWKTGDSKNTAREVKTVNYLYYRHTKQNGWRKYDKFYKEFRDKHFTGTSIIFVPKIQDDNSNTLHKVNLGR